MHLTNGSLPLAPFLHLRPTAVGLVELDRPIEAVTPSPTRGPSAHVDSLVLVRLHRDPLAVVHVPGSLAAFGPAELASLVWEQAAGAIEDHVCRYACADAPTSSADLVPGVGAESCPAEIPADPGASLTVIVPTGGRAEMLERCLRSLLATWRSDYEIVVVDNRPGEGDTRGVVERLGAATGRVRYLAEARPGSSVARNRGIAEVDSDLVVFTDDDVVVDPGWLTWLVAPFSDPGVTAVTGLVLPLELETAAQKRFEQYAGYSKGLEGRCFDLHQDRADDRVLYPYWGGMFGSGNSMAFRRGELVAAGGFDPALGAGSLALAGADIEAMSAAILRGGRLVYEPRSVCWHEHRRGDGALQRQLFNYGVGFTALLTKALVHDRRFLGTAARSARIVLRLRRERARAGELQRAAALPPELARLQLRGMLCGPRRYARSVRWARRLDLAAVIEGR